MRKSLGLRLRQTIFSWSMLSCLVVGLIMLLWFSVTNWLQFNRHIGSISFSEMCGNFLECIYNSHARSGFGLFMPVFAVLPASTIFCDDYNSGYIKSILLRGKKNGYLRETILCATVAGGLAVMLPDLIASIVFMIWGEPNYPTQYGTVVDESVFAGIQYVWDGRLVAILWLLSAFLSGAAWANIGLCISAFIPNRYVTLAAPFAIYYGAHLLLYRSGELLVLSPVNMVQPIAAFIPNLAYPYLYDIVLFSITVLIYYGAARRRLCDV